MTNFFDIVTSVIVVVLFLLFVVPIIIENVEYNKCDSILDECAKLKCIGNADFSSIRATAHKLDYQNCLLERQSKGDLNAG
jgi:hypothetical protein